MKIVFFCTVHDNNKFLFRISCGVGLLIELWKITKVSDVSFDFENPVMGLIPRLIVSNFIIPSHFNSLGGIYFLEKSAQPSTLSFFLDIWYVCAKRQKFVRVIFAKMGELTDFFLGWGGVV